MSPSQTQVRASSRLRRKWVVGATAACLIAAMGAAVIPAANAVHTTEAFELEGNAVRDSADDWANICAQDALNAGKNSAEVLAACGTTTGAPEATAVSFVAEPNLNSTIFTGGGSKDPQDVSSWAWKDGAGGLPDKDNLLNAFAARYSLPDSVDCPNGALPTDPSKPCEVLYFGSDRLDNSGDAHQAFWFFQNAIALGSNAVGGGIGFTGVHKPGDILVISNFSNGGTTSTIAVYEWDPTCLKASAACGNQNLRTLETSDAAQCSSTLPDGDPFCGIVNADNGADAPWPYTDKSGNSSYLQGEFYEGGVNLSFLGLGDRCFASVAAETRSSTSTTATLKDFVLGDFGDCTSHVTTQAQTSAGASVPAAGVSIGSGTVQVQDSATVTVSGVSQWAGSVQFSLCGPGTLVDPGTVTGCISGGASATTIGDPVPVSSGTPTITSPLTTLSSAGTYCWAGAFTATTEGVPNSVDDGVNECFKVTPVTPELDTTAGPDVFAGNPVTDTAVLTGTANRPGTPVINPTTPGGAAGGTITFTLYGPSETECGPLVFTSDAIAVGDLTGGARGATATSGNLNTPGEYHWVASYSGDSPNTLGDTHNTACDDTDEDVVVEQVQPTITTAQSWVPNDSATISATGGGNLTGSVRFRLYDNAACTGTALYDSNAISVSGASPQTKSTSNTTAITTSKTVSWLVEYSSTNVAQKDVTSTCNTENSVLTINNG